MSNKISARKKVINCKSNFRSKLFNKDVIANIVHIKSIITVLMLAYTYISHGKFGLIYKLKHKL